MPKANKKQRHEAKRRAKRAAIRRRGSISPVQRLAQAPDEPQCWISDNFEANGQMQLFVYKRGAGLTGMAAFLVDRGVVGLKDAWVRMQLDPDEMKDAIEASRQRGIDMRPATLEEVRRWVAGGIRWAHDNGMRLPRDLAKATSLIGGVGEWQSADVAGFVKEFAGHPDDLRQRLIGQPLDSYLRRQDIEFIFDTDAPYMDQETGRYSDWDAPQDLTQEQLQAIADDIPEDELQALAQRLAPVACALAEKTSAWLQAQGETPSNELPQAWSSIIVANMLSQSAMPDGDEEQVTEFSAELLESMAERIEPSRTADYDRGVDQVLRHLETDPALIQSSDISQHFDQAE